MGYKLPKGPRGDSPSDKGRRNKNPHPAKRKNGRTGTKLKSPKSGKGYKLPKSKGGRGDAPQQRKADSKRAAAHKKTPAYRGAVKAAAATQPLPKRKARLKRKSGTENDAAIKQQHEARLRAEEAADKGDRIRQYRHNVTTPKQKQAVELSVNRERRAAKEQAKAELVASIDAMSRPKKLKKTSSKLDKLTSPERTATMGLPGGPALSELLSGAAKQGGKQAAAVGLETVTDPKNTGKKTADSVLPALKAIPAAAVKSIVHPREMAKETVADYKRRYSGSVEDRRKRIREEGALPELADASIALTGGAAVVTKPLVRAAAAGKYGTKAERFAAKPRPALRTTGGAPRAQPLAQRPVRLATQRLRDRSRAKRDAKELRREKGGDAVRVTAARANEAAGKVVEVTPRLTSAARKKQRTAAAKMKGTRLYQLKSEQRLKVDKVARKAINQLDKHEQRAYYYVAAGLVSVDPAKARVQLRSLADSIIKEREAKGVKKPKGLLRGNDQLPEIERLIKDADKAFTPRVAETVRALRRQDVEVAAKDPGLMVDGKPNAEQILTRRHAQQAETLGIRRGEAGDLYNPDETVGQWARRVRKAADEAGLERPLYFPSEKFGHGPEFGVRAIGGTGAAAKPFRYTGELFREGRQNTDPSVYLQGLSRSIKRKHNWNLVADQLDAHALPNMQHTTIAQLRTKLAEDGIDEGSVSYWNPGIYRQALEAEDRAGNIEAADLLAAAREGDEFAQGKVASAVKQATAESVADIPSVLRQTTGWTAVPRAVYNEVHAGSVPGPLAPVGRAWDVAKGKSSKYLLGSNPVWLQFQFGANALQALVGSKGEALIDMLSGNSRRWRNALDDETRARIDAEIGAGAGSDAEAVRMGGAANSAFINGYRDLKAHPLWDKRIGGVGPSVKQLNPFELVLGVDRFQNDQFRHAMYFNSVKREAVARMGENMSGTARAQQRVIAILKRPPDENLKLATRDAAAIERHGQFVNDWMGDFTNYTSLERAGFKRYVMFYGFLRFSLRLTMYTLPVKHPLTAAVAVKLGQLEADEIRDLLGGDDLPWAFGKLYWTSDGDLKEIDLARMNPALNQVTGIEKYSQALSVAPPFVVMAVEQALHQSLYKGTDWKTGGKAAPYAAQDGDYLWATRARIAADDAGSLLFPYRVAKTMTQEGPQGDDSLLGSARPIVHKSDEGKKTDREKIEFERDSESLLRELIAALPQKSRDVAAAAERRAYDEPAKKKPRKKRGYGFSSSSYGSGGQKDSYSGSGSGGSYGP